MGELSDTGVTVAMDYQVLFNIAIGLCGAFGGWVLNNITSNIRSLAKDLKMLDEKHQETRETYVSKEDHKSDLADLGRQLDKIDRKFDHGVEKLENKLDRVLDHLAPPA